MTENNWQLWIIHGYDAIFAKSEKGETEGKNKLKKKDDRWLELKYILEDLEGSWFIGIEER